MSDRNCEKEQPLTVYCVIVTYNRAYLLEKLISAAAGQTRKPDRILVVDNCSTDGTRQLLSDLADSRDDLEPILLDANHGGAGGFYHGIRKAYRDGAEWIWTLDDDAVAERDALEALLKCSQLKPGNRPLGFLASRVLWKDGSLHRMNVPGKATVGDTGTGITRAAEPIAYASFVSILINRGAVEKVGLPIKEFFMYSDDVEFTWRITSAGFAALWVESSRVRHLTEKNSGISLEAIQVDQLNLGRWKYAVRNLVAVNRRRKYGKLREPVRLLYLVYCLNRNFVPLRYQAHLLRAGIGGLFMNFEKWIEHP